MKTAAAMIELVSVFCPECGEAHYDSNDGDWSNSSIERAGGKKLGGTIATCRVCGTKFRMPAIIDRIGK